MANVLLDDNSMRHNIRCRDGFRCVDCGMTEAEHRKVNRCRLAVHRLTPGSQYSMKGCVTVCRACHGKRHSGEHSPAGLRRNRLKITRLTCFVPVKDSTAEALLRLAESHGTSITIEANRLILKGLQE